MNPNLSFNFLNREGNGVNEDYVSMITNPNFRIYLENFFDPSLIEMIPRKEIINLIKRLNSDIDNKIFNIIEHRNVMVTDSFNKMTEEQMLSESHQLFLKIIKKYFGISAYNLLQERKNINIFNLQEIHVLHQTIFDNFGDYFVNQILNNDYTPHSLMIIKDVLTDKEKLEDFKFYYDFFKSNTQMTQADFERMIRGYESYKSLIREIRKIGRKLSNSQKNTIIEIFRDSKNKYQVLNLNDVNTFFEKKQKKYIVEKAKSKRAFLDGNHELATDILMGAFFEMFFDVSFDKETKEFSMIKSNPLVIREVFDLESILSPSNSLHNNFSEEEIKAIRDLMDIIDIYNSSASQEVIYDKIQCFCAKYENDGNRSHLCLYELVEKLSAVFSRDLLNSISTIESIEKRAKSEEEGVYLEQHPKTVGGKTIDLPVYVFDGADFLFLSSTNLYNGLSSNNITGNIAESWFQYENGTTHISCSYTNQTELRNLEFRKLWDGFTYLFDTGCIYTMGPDGIFTPSIARKSDVTSETNLTRFMEANKFVSAKSLNRVPDSFNEVAISRYSYGMDIHFGGKCIPSALLCTEEVSDRHLEIAQSFTEFCIKHKLKPSGWQMPIVVVKKSVYESRKKQQRYNILMRGSEYFSKGNNHEKDGETYSEGIKNNDNKNTLKNKM